MLTVPVARPRQRAVRGTGGLPCRSCIQSSALYTYSVRATHIFVTDLKLVGISERYDSEELADSRGPVLPVPGAALPREGHARGCVSAVHHQLDAHRHELEGGRNPKCFY